MTPEWGQDAAAWEAHYRARYARRERLTQEAGALMAALEDEMHDLCGDYAYTGLTPHATRHLSRLNRAHAAARARFIRRGGDGEDRAADQAERRRHEG